MGWRLYHSSQSSTASLACEIEWDHGSQLSLMERVPEKDPLQEGIRSADS